MEQRPDEEWGEEAERSETWRSAREAPADQGEEPSASEIVGEEEAEFDASIGELGRGPKRADDARLVSPRPSSDEPGVAPEAGSVSRGAGQSLGGTGTHHRASYSDPLPAVGMQQAASDDTDDATGRHTPGPGSPDWMRDAATQGGFGSRPGADARGGPIDRAPERGPRSGASDPPIGDESAGP